MTGFRARLLAFILATVGLAPAALAGTVHGTVINATTGKPVPNIGLDLLSPMQQMAIVGSAKSDAQGQFTASSDAIGAGPVLIRVTYHDVSFNTFVPPGSPEVKVEVYDTTKDPKAVKVASHVVIFEPREGKLIGAEEYNIQNTTQPPMSFYRTEGNFDFAIPQGATLGQVTATGSLGMDVKQASIDKGKGLYAIAYAFRPGNTNIRLSYELPYPNNAATVKLPATYPDMRLLLVAPPGVTLSGDGVTPAGKEQGMLVYIHDALPAKGVLSVSLSGVGAPEAADASGGAQEQQGQEGNSRVQGPQVEMAPPRLDDLRWPLIGGLVAIFALGGFLLWKKPVVVPAVAGDMAEEAVQPDPKKKEKASKPVPQPAQPVKQTVEAVQQQVSTSLDSLKEEIFRLELRRQAGTIPEDDFVREKTRVEQLLRDLVRG